jgi:hypothetical protein
MDLAITNPAASDDFVCLSLVTGASTMPFTCITSSQIKLSKILRTQKTELGFSFQAIW